MMHFAKILAWGFRDKTTGKQVMQVQARSLKEETLENIAMKVFAELNAGALVADAKEMARALKEAHSTV